MTPRGTTAEGVAADDVTRELDRRIADAAEPRASRLRATRALWVERQRIATGGGTPAEARAAAGLSLGQAVRETGLERHRLAAIEAGALMTPAEGARLQETYDCAGFADPTGPR